MNISPCPFCGKVDKSRVLNPITHPLLFTVECDHCGGRSEFSFTEEQAIARWNEVSDAFYAVKALRSENNAYRALSGGESPADYAIWSAKRESGRLLGIMKSLLAYARDGETDWSMLYKRIESYIETMESQ